MNKEEKDIIDFLRVSAITKIEKTILSKEDVKCLLNYIDEYKKRTTFFREEIYRLNKKADKLQKEFKDLELAYGLYKDRYETLQKENEELKNTDLTTVYMKGFYDSESKWKTKIKAKIKELEETSAKELRYDFLMNRDEVKNAFIRILEELLN